MVEQLPRPLEWEHVAASLSHVTASQSCSEATKQLFSEELENGVYWPSTVHTSCSCLEKLWERPDHVPKGSLGGGGPTPSWAGPTYCCCPPGLG